VLISEHSITVRYTNCTRYMHFVWFQIDRWKCLILMSSICRMCQEGVMNFVSVPKDVRLVFDLTIIQPLFILVLYAHSKATHTSICLTLILPGTSCLRNIVGARFHCAICDSVDICSNCESAGLPGNLDSADGGHNSSHILIKVCSLVHLYPVWLQLTNADSISFGNCRGTHSVFKKFAP